MTGYHCHLQGVLHSGQSIAIIVGLVLPPPGAVQAAVIAEVLRLNVLECRVYEYFLMSCPGVVR